MNNPYDLHSWSTQYLEDAMTETSRRRLEGRTQAGRRARSGRSRVGLIWDGMPLHVAAPSE